MGRLIGGGDWGGQKPRHAKKKLPNGIRLAGAGREELGGGGEKKKRGRTMTWGKPTKKGGEAGKKCLRT